MASNVIPFKESNVPAHIAAMFGAVQNNAYESQSLAVPSVSFRGKVWRIVVDGEETVLANPETGDPVASMEVVMVKGNPNRSKAYYGEKKFVEGENAEPVCASRDGVAPDIGTATPQCSTCAACPQNVWGSRISEAGKKVKACADSKRIAVVPAGDLSFQPLLLRVPATSLTDNDNKENEARGWYALSEYAKMLGKRGVPVEAVVTRIGFDSRPAHPKLLFKAMGYLGEEDAEKVIELQASEAVEAIVGAAVEGASHAAPAVDTEEFAPAPVKPKAEPAKPAPKKAKAVPPPDDDDAPEPVKPKAEPPPDDDDEPAGMPSKPVTKAAKPAETGGDASALKSKVASILGSLDIDDDDD